LNPYYFLCQPQTFYYNHFPSEAKWLLLKTPITLGEFEKALVLADGYFSHDLELITPHKAVIEMQSSAIFKLRKPQDVLVFAKVESLADKKEVEGAVFCQMQDSILVIETQLLEKGQYKLSINVKRNNVAGNSYKKAIQFLLNCKGSKNKNIGFPTLYEHFDANGCELYTPKQRFLKIGQKIAFKIKALQAKEVAVNIDGELTMLKNTNGVFEGEVAINGKDVAVFAKFNKTDSVFDGLLQYQTTK